MSKNVLKPVLLLLLVVPATWSLLLLPGLVGSALGRAWLSSVELDRRLKYQLVSLVLAGVVLLVLRLARRDVFARYFRIGSVRAPAERNPVFGIKAGESWRRVGWTLTVIITAVTGLVIGLQFFKGFTLTRPLTLLLWVPLLATVNAFVEEALTRFGVVVALDGYLPQGTVALISGLVFGTVHYFGTPGGPVGVVMAGVLGWVLARSVLETRGLLWAWWIHFVQDVIIISALLMVGS